MSRLLVALLVVATFAGSARALPRVPEKLAGLERHDGLIPWAWDAKEGKVFLQVDRPGTQFLYGAGISGGAGTIDASLDRGQLGDLGLCVFERAGPRLLLRRLQLAHRAGVTDRERARVVEESFATSVIAALPIVAESPGQVLVDATG